MILLSTVLSRHLVTSSPLFCWTSPPRGLLAPPLVLIFPFALVVLRQLPGQPFHWLLSTPGLSATTWTQPHPLPFTSCQFLLLFLPSGLLAWLLHEANIIITGRSCRLKNTVSLRKHYWCRNMRVGKYFKMEMCNSTECLKCILVTKGSMQNVMYCPSW